MRNKCLMLASLALVFLSAGCSAQQIPPAPVVTAPPVTSTSFAQLNAGTSNGGPVTALTYTDQPATGTFCYFVQTLDGQGVSAASNTVCATTTSSLKHVVLNWAAPAGYTCQSACTYVASRASAVSTPVGSPSLAAPSDTAELARPPVNPEFKLTLMASR